MDVKAGLSLESSYFNNDVGCYEPLIEPWIINVQSLQKTAMTSQEIELKSEQIMNFNMTYGMAIAMRKIQDRIDLNVNEWENEENIEKTRIDVRR